MNIHTHCHSSQPSFPTPQSASRSKSQEQSLSGVGQSALGAATPGLGAMLGGLVGSILGSLFCPIPFLGAALGALIGATLGNNLFDSQQNPGAACCCGTMEQNYGPMNAHMASGYGYPTEYQSLPQKFPQQSQCHLFPQNRMEACPAGLPLEQQKKPSVTHQVQQLTCHLPDSGDLDSHQVSLLPFGAEQRIETQGSNTGHQVQAAPIVGRDQVIRTGGDNAGNQVQVTPLVAGEQEIVTGGSNQGNQVQIAPVVAAEQRIIAAGDNEGNQTQVPALVAAPQHIVTGGDNSGNQSQLALVANEQVIVTESDNAGDQTAHALVAGGPQVIRTGVDNSGVQTERVVFGEVVQASHAEGANTGAQEAATSFGEGVQEGSGGDNSDFSQDLRATDGVQSFVAGANSEVDQHLNGGGEQVLRIESGEATQTEEGGATNQTIIADGVVVASQETESGHMFVDAAAGGIVSQDAESGMTTLFDDDASGAVRLGNGSGIYEGEGNGGDNHFLVDGSTQTDASPDLVRINTGGGDDTIVVNTSGGPDRFELDMGRGNEDRLVIDESNSPVRVELDGEMVYQGEGWTPENGTIAAQNAENMTVYREDGTFTRWSEDTGLVEGRDAGQPGEMSPVAAARTLREHAGFLDRAAGVDEADGIIGAPDLQAALSSPEMTPELREAIQYTQDNPALWNALDSRGAGDRRTDVNALNEFIDSYETREAPSEGPMTDRRAVEVLNYHSGLIDSAESGEADGRFRAADLQAIASGENSGLPTELREAASRFLGNEHLQDSVDAVSWEGNGLFSSRVFTEDDLAGFVAS